MRHAKAVIVSRARDRHNVVSVEMPVSVLERVFLGVRVTARVL